MELKDKKARQAVEMLAEKLGYYVKFYESGDLWVEDHQWKMREVQKRLGNLEKKMDAIMKHFGIEVVYVPAEVVVKEAKDGNPVE